MKTCEHKKIETTHYLLCVKCQMKWEKTLKLNENEVEFLVGMMEINADAHQSPLYQKMRKFLEVGE
jgi:hypothetical protein